MRFRVNSPEVISETIQGETIVINLTTGTYYSLPGSGAEIWEAVAAAATVDEIAGALEARYDAPLAELTAGVSDLVEELLSEQLIVATDATSSDLAVEPLEPRLAFEKPALGKYTDMQDLVLLDPVHEVDDRGWPHAKAEVAG
jgi:Coenzyme PQQ synthesis protein D (PqqD)